MARASLSNPQADEAPHQVRQETLLIVGAVHSRLRGCQEAWEQIVAWVVYSHLYFAGQQSLYFDL